MPKGKNSKAEYKAMIKEPRDYSRLYEAAKVFEGLAREEWDRK